MRGLFALLLCLLAWPANAQQSYNVLGYCQVVNPIGVVMFSGSGSLAICAAGSGPIPTNAKYIEVCVEVGQIRYLSNGAPTGSIGMPVAAGTCFGYSGPIYSIQFTSVTGTATINVEFFQ